MKDNLIHRREFLKLAGLAALGTASACAPASETPAQDASWKPVTLPPQPTSMATETTPPTQTPTPTQASEIASVSPCTHGKRVLRVAHLTDIHVQPEGIAPDGMVKALRHAQEQPDPPDLIINTGDSIMDSLNTNKARTQAQWEVFNSILTAECKLPIIHAIGNHDVWGWAHPDQSIRSDPLYGKNMAIEKLGLSHRYYSFDQAGWHFIVLDSNHPPNEVSGYPYIGKLDEEQFAWLVQDVESTPHEMPICILSHIPIVAACEYFDGPNEDSGNWVVPAAWMHIDARRFRQFFLQHPNIRLCLSGHTHQLEALDYLGVRYLTNGAVCGNWWNGTYLDFPPAYVMVDLYQDGSFESISVHYENV